MTGKNPGKHGLFDLNVKTVGDIEVDGHHTIEDTGIVIGQALTGLEIHELHVAGLGQRRGHHRDADAAVQFAPDVAA